MVRPPAANKGAKKIVKRKEGAPTVRASKPPTAPEAPPPQKSSSPSPAAPAPPPVKKRTPPEGVTTKIAVVGIPSSGKTTYFRYLSGHFGLNLPITYIPSMKASSLPIFGDLNREVVMEETTYETVDPTNPSAEMETTIRNYVSRPTEDPTKLFVELSASREDQGILTKYPLPTKYNQFVDMKLFFSYGTREKPSEVQPMVLHTVDEAGGIISDYFTYDRLWIHSPSDEVPREKCVVIPQFDTWPKDRQELWRHGLTLMGRFVSDADGIVLLLSPQLNSLKESSQQVNLARGVIRYVRERNIPLVIAISKADLLKDFYSEVEQVLTSQGYASGFDIPAFLVDRDGSGLGSILIAAQASNLFDVHSDSFLVASAISTGESRPLLYSDMPTASSGDGFPTGVPVMVNTTLPIARICERVLQKKSPPSAPGGAE
jgi:signal recognition particle receptor subunit beta